VYSDIASEQTCPVPGPDEEAPRLRLLSIAVVVSALAASSIAGRVDVKLIFPGMAFVLGWTQLVGL